jgi:hypothetical protein
LGEGAINGVVLFFKKGAYPQKKNEVSLSLALLDFTEHAKRQKGILFFLLLFKKK